MSGRTLAVFIGVLAVLGLLAYGVLGKGNGAIAVGEDAPDKELQTLDGSKTKSLTDYRGSWVLLNFWASWCDPCRDEAPALEDLQRRRGGERFTVLGINLDDNRDDAVSFVEEFELTYPQLRDGDGRDRREAYAMTGFPESFLIDPEGDIALIRRGPVDREFLADEVEPLIAGDR